MFTLGEDIIMGRDSGFSIFGLLTAMAIIAVVSAAAAPPLLNWLDGARLKSAAEGLRADLQEAKSQAVRRRQTVKIEFSENGYLIFVDEDRSGDFDQGEPIIRKRQVRSGIKVVQGATVLAGGREEQPNSSTESEGTKGTAGGRGQQGKEDKENGGGGGNLLKPPKGKSNKTQIAGTSPSNEGAETVARSVSFDSMGMCQNSSSFTLVNMKGERRQVTINLTGTIKTEKLADG